MPLREFYGCMFDNSVPSLVCLSLFMVVSSHVSLCIPARAHKPPPHPLWPSQPTPVPPTPSLSGPPLYQPSGCRSVRTRSTLSPSHLVLSTLQLKVSEHDSLWQLPTAHLDERPRPHKSLRAHGCVSGLTSSHLESMVLRSHPVVWSLALCPDDAKQDPVVYGTEFGVVFLAKGTRASFIQEGLDCLGLYRSGLKGSANFGSLGSSRRYLLMRIQHARVHLAISVDKSGSTVTVPPR